MYGAGGSEGRVEDNKLEWCALMRGEDDVVDEMDLLPFGLFLPLLLCQADILYFKL